ncbi:MAG TPA: hypothetical protein VML55_07770 [Planctomycetaceae bacterium]|nr:hypothetical protein [Planctomycetaceae bacterium]
MEIRYLNTDFDLVASSHLQPLVSALRAYGLRALHVTLGGDGLWYSILETEEDYDEPDGTIGAMLAAIESLEDDAAREWSACRLREFNIGYDCGDDPWAFNNELTNDTLRRIAALGASLRITIYPQRPEKKRADEPQTQ